VEMEGTELYTSKSSAHLCETSCEKDSGDKPNKPKTCAIELSIVRSNFLEESLLQNQNHYIVVHDYPFFRMNSN
jgi:hypothetical protein